MTTPAPLATFGPGILICTRIDIANGTPVNIGYAQELSLDFTGEGKELFGQNQLPLVIARGTMKLTGKIKAAMINAVAFNNCFWGQTLTNGAKQWSIAESFTVPAAGGTVTVAQSAQFDADLGAVYAANNIPFLRSAVAPTVGQYSVGAGTYAFASADQTLGVAITYTYTVATGQSLAITNQLIGTTPAFQMDYYTNLNQPSSRPFAVRIYYAVGNKLTMQFKLNDFQMPEFDFMCGALGSGKVVDKLIPVVS